MFSRRSLSSVHQISARNRIVSSQVGSNLSRLLKRTLKSNCQRLDLNGVETVATSATVLFEQLNSRGLIRVAGRDAGKFLQGLVTNDMRHFQQASRLNTAMFSMLLNQQGRLLYDVIIYNLSGDQLHQNNNNNNNNNNNVESSFLIECDARIEADLRQHLNAFNIRKQIDVTSSTGEHKVWALLPRHWQNSHRQLAVAPPSADELNGFPDDSLLDGRWARQKSSTSHLLCVKDPRLPSMCVRLILDASKTPPDVLGPEVCRTTSDEDVDLYATVRYRCGIAEGSAEMPPAKCLPLECNGDYLRGVSFEKGCYVGQELTSRMHHTGVVRKRHMPLVFDSAVKSFVGEPLVKDSNDKVVGKVRGWKGRLAIGTMRIEQCTKASAKLYCQVRSDDDDDDEKRVETISVKVRKPFWWPKDI